MSYSDKYSFRETEFTDKFESQSNDFEDKYTRHALTWNEAFQTWDEMLQSWDSLSGIVYQDKYVIA